MKTISAKLIQIVLADRQVIYRPATAAEEDRGGVVRATVAEATGSCGRCGGAARYFVRLRIKGADCGRSKVCQKCLVVRFGVSVQ